MKAVFVRVLSIAVLRRTSRFRFAGRVLACLLVLICSGYLLASDVPGTQASLCGGYLEVRAVDVDLARLLRVPEIDAVGEVAILAWKIHDGRWDGQDLSGLQVAAAVCSRQQLLDDALERGGELNTVVFVDDKATPEEARALISLVEKLTDKKLGRVVQVRKTSVTIEVVEDVWTREDARHDSDEGEHSTGTVTLEIADVLRVSAAVKDEHDATCGAVCGGHGQGSGDELHATLSQTEKRYHASTDEYSLLGESDSGADSDASSKTAVVGAFSL